MPREKNLDGFRNAGNQVIAFAFAYVITGDQRFLRLTADHLLAYSSWKYWGDERGYGQRDLGFHHILMGSSIAFDWVYGDLSEQDRKVIGYSLARRAQESYEASTSEVTIELNNWWRKAYIQNHNWINYSALGMAALALEGEDSRAETWLGQAVDDLEKVSYLLKGIEDGTWHEGVPYQTYGLTMSLPFLYNYRELKGRDLIPHDYLRGFVGWKIYSALPNTDRFAVPYGDLSWEWANAYGPEGIMRFAAREYRDPQAEWMARQIASAVPRRPDAYAAPWEVFEFLYYDSTVPPRSPDALPKLRLFPDLGAVIWRTGWGPQDLIFGLKSSAPGGRFPYESFVNRQYPFERSTGGDFSVGHDHADALTFYFYRGKTDLSSETIGQGRDSTRYHNTLLVDGEGQYQPPSGDRSSDSGVPFYEGTDGWIETVAEGKQLAYIVADATNRYRSVSGGRPDQPLLNRLKRYAVMSREGYVLMVDDVESNTPREYEWIAHFGRSVSVEGDWLKGQAEDGNVLGVNIVAPSDFSVSRGEDGKPYARVRPSRDAKDTRFATVLFPTEESRWKDKPEISSLGDNGRMIGLRLGLNGVQDHLIRYREESSGTIGGYSLDGTVASISKGSDGTLQRLFLGNGSKFSDSEGSRVLIEAPRASQAIEVDFQGGAVAVTGDVVGGVRIFAPGVDPNQVTVNGQRAGVSQQGDYIELRG